MLINDVSRHIHYTIQMEAEKLGLRGAYHPILFHLTHEDGITQLELAKRSHLKPPTISVSLKKMEEDGLIERKTDENDMRQMRVYLTEKGRELDRQFKDSLDNIEGILASILTEEECASFREELIKIRDYQRKHYNFKGRKPE